jgi:DNA-binding response OmpR family regulator
MNERATIQCQRIVIVEDDRDLARGLARLLKAAGFDAVLAYNGVELRAVLGRGDVDLVLLDLNLMGEDGMDIARDLGRTRSTGLIIVTGRLGNDHCVAGLDAGADDYVAKPFEHAVLLARIRAVLRRRMRARDARPILAAGVYRLNTVARLLTREGDAARIPLTATETALLACLMTHEGVPVHRADLARGQSWTPDDRATDVHVSHIRRKLLVGGMADLRIQPVRGYGYRLTVINRAGVAAA